MLLIVTVYAINSNVPDSVIALFLCPCYCCHSQLVSNTRQVVSDMILTLSLNRRPFPAHPPIPPVTSPLIT